MKVTVYSTSGKNNVTIETNATTFGQLKPTLVEHGFNLSGMKAVVGETKVTLEADGVILPTEDFKLFLMPVKTKSGVDIQSLDRPGIYSEIQRLIEKDGDSARNHFNQHGNYTRTKTIDLKDLLSSYSESTSPISASDNIIGDGVMVWVSKNGLESVLEKLLDIDSNDLSSTDESTFDEAVDELQNIIDSSSTINSVSEQSTVETKRELTPEELEIQRLAQEEKDRKLALEREANELKDMFPDVR